MENHLKIQVLVKNQNLLLKKKEESKEIKQKKQNKTKFSSKPKYLLSFLKFPKKKFNV